MWTLSNLVLVSAIFLATFSNHLQYSLASRLIHEQCYTKWLTGYKLASGRPTKVLKSVSLHTCEQECLVTKGCAAFAYGVAAQSNGTCELATRMVRDSRSVNNATLSYEDVNKDNAYDVYIESRADGCLPTSPLFQSPSNHLQGSGGGVPIDCFYRLMSGKRLSKNHVLKAVSVNNLQDCQEACIAEKTFVCRAISYRYMATGYTYNVANCELSPFYLVNGEDSSRTKYDFVDDYDYDFFQREPHCKTTSSIGAHFGVCALVSRRGAKLNNLVKSAHSVSTPSHCEHLCTTALFRCRAFSFRHTERGRERDPFHRRDSQEYDNCFLHDVDITRLPAQNIVPDPDYDLFEMGRLMGHECVLYDQYVSRRPGDYDRERDPIRDRERDPIRDRDQHRYPPPPPSTSSSWSSTHHDNYRPIYHDDRDRLDRDRDRYDYHSRRPGYYDRPQDRVDSVSPHLPRPGTATHVQGSGGSTGVSHLSGTTGPSGGGGNSIGFSSGSNSFKPSAPSSASHEYLPPRFPSPTPTEPDYLHKNPAATGPDYLHKNPGNSAPAYLQNRPQLPPVDHPRLPPPIVAVSNPINPSRPGHYFDRNQDSSGMRDYNSHRDYDERDRGVDRSRERDHAYPPLHSTTLPGHDSSQALPPAVSTSAVTVIDDRRVTTTEPPYYDKKKEVCLVQLKRDSYLAPEQSRATFPVKTVEECRVECLRSMEVLRFPCKTMSFRLTSATGGSCQLSDMEERELRAGDFIAARDRYDNAVIFSYDERADPSCRREDVRYGSGVDYNRDRDRDRYYGDRTGYTYVGTTSTTIQDNNNRRYDAGNRYYDTGSGTGSGYNRYDTSRYDTSRYDDRFQSGRPYAPVDDHATRYGSTSSSGMGYDRYNTNSKGFYDDRRVDDYNRYGYYLPGSQTGTAMSSGHRFSSSSSSAGYPPYRGTDRLGSEDKTVNGERCLRSCRQNREAGFYYCQVDESGSWDFCCRPDHFCGYSRGLAVPWCYVGSGPSHNIWRSCNHRALSDRNPTFSPTVSYLHDRLPPTVNSLTNTEVANLTRDNALLLFKGSPADFKLDTAISSSEVFPTNTTAPEYHRHPAMALQNSPNVEPIKFGNVIEEEQSQAAATNSSRSNRSRSPRKQNVRVVKVARRVPATTDAPQ